MRIGYIEETPLNNKLKNAYIGILERKIFLNKDELKLVKKFLRALEDIGIICYYL